MEATGRLGAIKYHKTTDMAADRKLVGVGGGMKQTKMICTLCPTHLDNMHQPNPIGMKDGVAIIIIFSVVQQRI